MKMRRCKRDRSAGGCYNPTVGVTGERFVEACASFSRLPNSLIASSLTESFAHFLNLLITY